LIPSAPVQKKPVGIQIPEKGQWIYPLFSDEYYEEIVWRRLWWVRVFYRRNIVRWTVALLYKCGVGKIFGWLPARPKRSVGQDYDSAAHRAGPEKLGREMTGDYASS